jgi:hypothetical protein
MKKTILAAVLTTLLTNLIINSWLLLALALIIGWFWVGNFIMGLAKKRDYEPEGVGWLLLMGPFGIFLFLLEFKLDGLKDINSAVINFWK